MGVEIERRFLVAADGWQAHVQTGRKLEQGYICASEGGVTVRVRHDGRGGWITLKAPSGVDAATRLEFEYHVPLADARCLLSRCRSRLSKERFSLGLPGEGLWVVDRFFGANEGLLLAEVELDDPATPISLPPWLGIEVTGDGRLSNAALASRPWSAWPAEEKQALGAMVP